MTFLQHSHWVRSSPVRHPRLEGHAVLFGTTTQLQVPLGLDLADEFCLVGLCQHRLLALPAGITRAVLRTALAPKPWQGCRWLLTVPQRVIRESSTHWTTPSCKHGCGGHTLAKGHARGPCVPLECCQNALIFLRSLSRSAYFTLCLAICVIS